MMVGSKPMTLSWMASFLDVVVLPELEGPGDEDHLDFAGLRRDLVGYRGDLLVLQRLGHLDVVLDALGRVDLVEGAHRGHAEDAGALPRLLGYGVEHGSSTNSVRVSGASLCG
jgi:hypothetical protein